MESGSTSSEVNKKDGEYGSGEQTDSWVDMEDLVEDLQDDVIDVRRVADDSAHGVCSGGLGEGVSGVDTDVDVDSVHDDAGGDDEVNGSDVYVLEQSLRVRAPHVRFSQEVQSSSGSIRLLGTGSADKFTLKTLCSLPRTNRSDPGPFSSHCRKFRSATTLPEHQHHVEQPVLRAPAITGSGPTYSTSSCAISAIPSVLR
eukprot:TRINITY_DN11187_c0_g3_i1.p1 TRINITY_DN11187_c0_g3~~TRINITY_DN11187_c0_g3_i1.p1  ORF type:complete len:200 (-),score=30.03 TRINITY_DN11187_c0_g3_i1:391-990(-)